MKLPKILRKAPPPTPLASSRIPDIPFSKLPRDIARKLRAAAARIRRILFLRGFCAVVATLFIATLAIMGIDAILQPESNHTVRWCLWAAGLVAVVVVARVALVKPLSQKLTPARLAALLERNHPELQERISTVVELMAMPDSVSEGSRELMEVITSAAITDVKGLSPRNEFSIRTVRPRFVLAAVAVGILVLLVSLPKIGPLARRQFVRAIAPAADIDNIYADNLAVTPGRDQDVVLGDPFDIELAVTGGFPGEAYVLKEPLDGSSRETRERMSPGPAARGEGVRFYRFTIGAVDRSFRYRVKCGSAVTRAYTVTARPRPAFQRLEAVLEYPSYTGARPRTVSGKDLDIRAVEGTKVTLRVLSNGTPDRPVKTALRLPDGERPASSSPKTEWPFVLGPGLAGNWELTFSDAHGNSNRPPVVHSVEIVKDAVPTVVFTSPTNTNFRTNPYDRIPFKFEAKDDFGIGAPVLEISRNGGAWSDVRRLSAAPSGPGACAGSGTIELGVVGVEGLASARFRIRVRDNFPGDDDAHAGFSAPIVVHFDREAKTLAAQSAEKASEKAKGDIDKAQSALRDAIQKAREAKQQALARREEDCNARLADCKEAAVRSGDELREMIRELREQGFEGLIPDVESVIRSELARAEDQAVEAISTPIEERVPAVDRLIKTLTDAQKRLDELQKERAEIADKLSEAEKMQTLADRQEALAAEAERAAEMTEAERKDWEKRQEQLRKEFEEQAAKLSDDPLSEQKKKADNLSKEAKELSEIQKRLDELQKKLTGSEAERKEAAEELRKRDPDAPRDTLPEDLLAREQKTMEEKAADLASEIQALDEQLRKGGAKTPEDVEKARQEAQDARQEAQDAAERAEKRADGIEDSLREKGEAEGRDPKALQDSMDAMKEALDKLEKDARESGEKTDSASLEKSMENAANDMQKAAEAMDRAADSIQQQSQELAAERKAAIEAALQAMQEALEQMQQQGEWAKEHPNWDGQQDQNADVPESDWDPNAQHAPWDGQQDQNAQDEQQGEWDPNADHAPWDGQQDQNAQDEQQGEWDPNADHAPWDGQKDPNAQDEQQNGQWDPNAKREPWDGQQDPNAKDEQQNGQWDPNAKRDKWDGQKDPNAKDEPNKDGQWDPNAKREPWDGRRDPNAQQQQQQGQQQQGKQQQQQGPQSPQQKAQQAAQQAAQQMQQMAQQMQQQAGMQPQQQQGGQQQQQQQQGGMQQQQQQGGKQQQQQGKQQQNQQNQQNQQPSQQQEGGEHRGPHSNQPVKNDGIILMPPESEASGGWVRVEGGGSTDSIGKGDDGAFPEYKDLNSRYFEALSREK